MTNEDFIRKNRLLDAKQLALKKQPETIDLKFCLQQIEGWQIARKKIPYWAATEDIVYPPRISMEQCSSQQTAEYKRGVAERLFPEEQRKLFVDLTGGFGIDFSYIASAFEHAIYVEEQPHLCEMAAKNFVCLDLKNAQVVRGNALQFAIPKDTDLIYLDPARRDGVGRKVVALEDCSPNIVEQQKVWLASAKRVMVKLSPMLDITMAIRQLIGVSEVHVVAVEGECKELLFVLDGQHSSQEIVFCCTELGHKVEIYSCKQNERDLLPEVLPQTGLQVGGYLHEPNASILKAHVQEALAKECNLQKLHPQSNLYYSEKPLELYNGFYRSFKIDAWSGFGKKELKSLLSNMEQANLTVRNFPSSVADLRKRLRLREGGSAYLFATTLSENNHVLLRCSKVNDME